MELNNLFWVTFQSSIILGLVHGVNPCGHSWLVLAHFVVGQKKGGQGCLVDDLFFGRNCCRLSNFRSVVRIGFGCYP